MLDILTEYLLLISAKRAGRKEGYWMGARPLLWFAPLFLLCALAAWQHFS